MKTPTPEKELEMRQQADRLRKQLGRIDEKRREEENAKLIGRCFKYRNSYGSGKKWWLYTKVTKGGYWPQAFSFQQTSHKTYEVRSEESFPSIAGYVPVSEGEFKKALSNFMGRMQDAANSVVR